MDDGVVIRIAGVADGQVVGAIGKRGSCEGADAFRRAQSQIQRGLQRDTERRLGTLRRLPSRHSPGDFARHVLRPSGAAFSHRTGLRLHLVLKRFRILRNGVERERRAV